MSGMNDIDARLIDEFIDALWLADGLAKNTLAGYRSDLQLFAIWLVARGTTLSTATEVTINDYLAHLHARAGSIKTTSQRRLMASLKRLYRWLLDQGRTQSDPLRNIEKPKAIQRFPKTLAEKQVTDLLDAPDTNTALGLRDHAMLELLYATGLRVSELIGLRLFELNLNDNVVRVMGKRVKRAAGAIRRSGRRLAGALYS
jgi:integrase/recombinase XerD